MDQLAQELAQLKAEAEQLRLQGNDSAYIAKLREAEAKQQELDNISQTKEVVDSVTQSIANTDVININGAEYTIEDLAYDSDAAMLLRQGLRQIKAQVTEKLTNWVNDSNSKDATIQTLKAQITQLQSDNANLSLQLEDITAKRDAAVQKAEEIQADNDKLTAQIEDLRKQMADSASASTNVIEIETDADLAAAAERLKAKKEAQAKAAAAAAEASKIRIYDVQQGDLKGSYFTAKRADTDETINIPWTEMNNYVKLSDEEAARFREDYLAAQKAAVDAVPESDSQDAGDNSADAGVAIPPATFQDDAETAQVGGNTPASQDVPDVVGAGVASEGLAQKFEELSYRVTQIEVKLGMIQNPSEAA